MTSGSTIGVPPIRDEFGFIELDSPEISSGGVTITQQSEGVFVSRVNEVSQNVGILWEGDEIKTRNGKFYIQNDVTGVLTFSERFGSKDVFFGTQFIQAHELLQIAGESQVFAVLNSES